MADLGRLCRYYLDGRGHERVLCPLDSLVEQVHQYGSKFPQSYSSADHNVEVYFSITLLVTTFITILACAAPNYAPASEVFVQITNSTGWSNDGFAFILCIVNALYGFLGADCGAHLCEEIPNPTVNVPKVIVSALSLELSPNRSSDNALTKETHRSSPS